jgi:hypothetical protein
MVEKGHVRSRLMRWGVGMALLLALFTVTAPAGGAETRTVTADPELEKSSFHTFWWGDGYRDLWTTPIEMEVLDLRKEAGGLEIVRRVGGFQTPGLALKGADGRSYTFRSVKKDLIASIPVEWQETVVAERVQDQSAASHPGAFAFMNALPPPFPWADQPPQRLVVMPDDPILGEHRELFANMLGTFGEFPLPAEKGRPGFLGATEILSSTDLWYRWLEGPENRVDTELFLRYRIADLWTGNWDRHSGQWRWARLPGKETWRPIAEDPDYVFVHFGGALLAFARGGAPKLVAFKEEISPMEGMAFNGSDIDRWVLTDLDREAFLRETRKMQSELTDEVIDNALKAMPKEWYDLSGKELGEMLRKRRDKLEEGVERYYRWLAREVNIHGNNRDEVARVLRGDDGSVEITLGLDEEGAEPYYRRRFEPKETKEVRLYLHDGNDRVVSEGKPGGGVKVRVIGGPGDDTVDDSRGGGTKLYDFEGKNEVIEGKGTKVDERPWENPFPSEANPWLEPRDFGSWWLMEGYAWWENDLGLYFNGGFNKTKWGFRKFPHDRFIRASVGYSTKRGSGDVRYEDSFCRTNSDFCATSSLKFSGISSLNFFGFGNDTVKIDELDDRDFYEVEQNLFRGTQTVDWKPTGQSKLYSGVRLQYTDENSSDTLIAETQPYGDGEFGQAGLILGLDWDSRMPDKTLLPAAQVSRETKEKPKEAARTGITVGIEGSLYPKVWDVEDTFGSLEGEVAGTLQLGRGRNTTGRVVFAARVGGRKVWGYFPWHDAAFIGGSRSNRGLASQRLAGDESLYGNAEVRLHLFSITNVLPTRWWVLGLADAGRVWVDGESSDEWHPSYGAGLVVELMATPHKLRVEWARNEDDDTNRFYLSLGFSF